jgi:hypothetical protein
LRENKAAKNSISEAHWAAYEALKKEFGVHPKLAQDCYRHAAAVYSLG